MFLMKKIICFGTRDYEKSIMLDIAKKHNYILEFNGQFLDDSNYKLALGYEIVLLRGIKPLTYPSMLDLKNHGLKCLVTRTAGYNNLDIEGAKKLNLEVSYAPGYSPNAISELTLSLALDLIHNVSYICDKTKDFDFAINDNSFVRETRDLIIGIIGTGRIGVTTAKLFHGIGSKVLGYDPYQNPKNKDILTYVDFDTLLKNSDVICIHAPYIKGSNDNLINIDTVKKMKKDVIIINSARGDLVDISAINKGFDLGIIKGFGADVIKNETSYFGKDLKGRKTNDQEINKLISRYPSVLITPHIASATTHALIDMMEISLTNIDEYYKVGYSKNSLTKKQ